MGTGLGGSSRDPIEGLYAVTPTQPKIELLEAAKGFTICEAFEIEEVEISKGGIYMGDDTKAYKAFKVVSSDTFNKDTIVILNSYTEHNIKTKMYYISKTTDVVGMIHL